MNRRQFLRYSALCGFSLTLGNLYSCTLPPKYSQEDLALIKEIKFIDAHAHPDWHYIGYMKELRMAASCFAAVGDRIYQSGCRLRGSEYDSTMAKLESWKGDASRGEIKLIRKASDVPDTIGPDALPGAILSIEGGDPLEGKPERVDEFYHFGVRIITLIHDRNNELGDSKTSHKYTTPGQMNRGLTRAGNEIAERMWSLGMVVDVAHAQSETLKRIAELAVRSHKPLLASHTSPCRAGQSSKCGGFFTWEDMELVAKTGGVVCTWPRSHSGDNFFRRTLSDWAGDNLEMKKRLGIDHIGLGTDSGTASDSFIEGYRDIRDLVHLVRAMQEIGFSHEEIAAYMGGNFYRVFRSCAG